jgi:hypothetical protein
MTKSRRKPSPQRRLRMQLGSTMPLYLVDYVDDLAECQGEIYWRRTRSQIIALIVEQHAISANYTIPKTKEKG